MLLIPADTTLTNCHSYDLTISSSLTTWFREIDEDTTITDKVTYSLWGLYVEDLPAYSLSNALFWTTTLHVALVSGKLPAVSEREAVTLQVLYGTGRDWLGTDTSNHPKIPQITIAPSLRLTLPHSFWRSSSATAWESASSDEREACALLAAWTGCQDGRPIQKQSASHVWRLTTDMMSILNWTAPIDDPARENKPVIPHTISPAPLDQKTDEPPRSAIIEGANAAVDIDTDEDVGRARDGFAHEPNDLIGQSELGFATIDDFDDGADTDLSPPHLLGPTDIWDTNEPQTSVNPAPDLVSPPLNPRDTVVTAGHSRPSIPLQIDPLIITSTAEGDIGQSSSVDTAGERRTGSERCSACIKAKQDVCLIPSASKGRKKNACVRCRKAKSSCNAYTAGRDLNPDLLRQTADLSVQCLADRPKFEDVLQSREDRQAGDEDRSDDDGSSREPANHVLESLRKVASAFEAAASSTKLFLLANPVVKVAVNERGCEVLE